MGGTQGEREGAEPIHSVQIYTDGRDYTQLQNLIYYYDETIVASKFPRR